MEGARAPSPAAAAATSDSTRPPANDPATEPCPLTSTHSLHFCTVLHPQGSSVPSPIVRTNRPGGDVGTSPGINPITPYTTASLDYRASWIAGEMMKKTRDASGNPNTSAKLWGETLTNESRAMQNSIAKPAQRTVLAPPPHHTRFVENSGLDRSLSTNIPDHPTAIQVNGLRQERTEHVMCPGHVYGVNSYDARVLCGNWAEERCDKSYVPPPNKMPSGSIGMRTTYNDMTQNRRTRCCRRRRPTR